LGGSLATDSVVIAVFGAAVNLEFRDQRWI
jgi:hypothetical protein